MAHLAGGGGSAIFITSNLRHNGEKLAVGARETRVHGGVGLSGRREERILGGGDDHWLPV